MVTLNLTILSASTGTDVIESCGPYTWIDGTTYTVSNTTATHTVTNAAGCDSVITLNLTVMEIDVSVNVSLGGSSASCNASGATYQWIDCNNGNTAISGATEQSFTATANSEYAAIITVGSCSDTTDCISLIATGIDALAAEPHLTVYPNPARDAATVIASTSSLSGQLTLRNLQGQQVNLPIRQVANNQYALNLSGLAAGLYILEWRTETSTVVTRLVVH